MFGKLIASVVEGVIDTAELGISIASDAVKSPVRLIEKVDPYGLHEKKGFLHDTKEKIQEIKDRD